MRLIGSIIAFILCASSFVVSAEEAPSIVTLADEFDRPTSRETLLDGKRYRLDRFFWNNSLLTSHAIEDGEGRVLSCETFCYDADNRLIKKTLYGDLSGNSSSSILLQDSGVPVDNGVESYSIAYTYSENSSQVLQTSEDNGKSTRYIYHPTHEKLLAQLTCDSERILIRQFYSYDDAGRLISTCIDDGNSEDAQDLSGVTERKITSWTLSEAGCTIEHRAFDPKTQQEVLLTKSEQSYSARGDLEQQVVLDANERYCYAIHTQYDGRGQAVATLDTTGKVQSREFDDSGNLLQTQGTHELRQWDYDASGHPIQVQEVNDSCALSAASYQYDEKGRKITAIDDGGNVTRFTYDGLGRLVSTIYPEVLDSEGQPVQYASILQYNCFDRIVSKTDRNGHTTHFTYNCRGQPTMIRHPDHSTETFRYQLDGTLLSHQDTTGMVTHYRHDSLGHLVEEERVTASGKRASVVSHTYSAFHRLSHTDANGIVTTYSYDPAGRLSEHVTHTEQGRLRTAYQYDSRGALIKIQEWFGDGPNDFTITSYERDGSGNILQTRIENADGTAVKQRKEKPSHQVAVDTFTNTEYDALGHPTSEETTDIHHNVLSHCNMRHDGEGHKIWEERIVQDLTGASRKLVTTWRYDAMGRLLQTTEDAEGEPATTSYAYNNAGNLSSVVKPDGIIITYLYDEQQRLVRLVSSDGTVDYTLDHDDSGRVLNIDDNIAKERSCRVYNSGRQVLQDILGNGLTIQNTFDRKGRRCGMSLPDSSSVQYEYDALFLRSIKRLSPTCEEQYCHQYLQYDRSGHTLDEQLIGKAGRVQRSWSTDHRCTGISSPHWAASLPEEGYDAKGNIQQIVVSDAVGCFSRYYQYDAENRLTHEIGQDEHSFSYDTLSNNISPGRAIRGWNQLVKRGSTTYAYDVNGNLVEKREGDSTTRYSYDALDRLIAVTVDDVSRTTYHYDLFHRRLSTQTSRWNNDTHEWEAQDTQKFLYDGDSEIGSIDSSGTLREFRVLGNGLVADIGSTIAIEINDLAKTGVYAPIHDMRGSISCLVDATSGKVAETYRYSAFGEETILGQRKQPLNESLTHNPWRFSSKRVDDDGLVAFGRRYYDPSAGRWITPDPLGHIDGPNRYAYVKNNPVNHIDPLGLFSLWSVWDATCDFYNYMADSSTHVMRYLAGQFEPLGIPQASVEATANDVFGEQFLVFAGYYTTEGTHGICGKGEVNSKVRITCINGIMTPLSTHIEQLQMLSASHGNTNVHYIYRPTNGFTWDISQAGVMKFVNYYSAETIQLAEKWKALIKDMGGAEQGGLIIHYCHSAGICESYLAKQLLTPQEQKMIRFRTFGSFILHPGNGLESVTHYVSVRDGVSYLDPIAYLQALIKNDPNVVFLGSHAEGPPIIDHLFTTDTYRAIWEKLGRDFTHRYGKIE